MKTPFIVLLQNAGLPLVEAGGKRLDTLREDIYDNARNTTNSVDICGVYAVALSGGEPYSVWR